MGILFKEILYVFAEEQMDVIKQWAGYSEFSATDSEVMQSLHISNDTANVSLPKWAKQTLGEWTVTNQISINDLKHALSYLYNNLD